MKRFRQHLQEALIQLDEADIQMLSRQIITWAKPVYEAFPTGPLTREDEQRVSKAAREFFMLGDEKNMVTFHSKHLRSKTAKAANEIKPIEILIMPRVANNAYNPKDSVIKLGVTVSAVNGATAVDMVPYHQIKMLRNEFSPTKIRSTVRHELTHWIDDALHNLHTSKVASTATNVQFHNYIKGGTEHAYLGHIEITAAVNTIDQIRSDIGVSEYNKLTWPELVSLNSGLGSLDDALGAVWRNKIWHRMAREGLMTPNLRRLE